MKYTMRPAVLAAVVALSACKQQLPPPTPVPPAPQVAGYGDVPPQTVAANVPGGAAQKFVLDMDVPGQWWTLFHSAELNALVAEGMQANPDIAAAQATLRAAREAYYAQRASAYPIARGSFSVSRVQCSSIYPPPLATSNSLFYGLHTAALDVAYTPEVFGGVRYQTQTAAAAVDVQRFAVEATYLTLTANIAATAFQTASVRDQIDATQRIIDIERQQVDIVKASQAYGQASELDTLTQEAALRATEQTLPPLRNQLAQARNELARLVGRTPDGAPDAAFHLQSLHLPEELPLSLPSKLIGQRPDIAAASAVVAVTGAQVGVAHAARLPNFEITSQTATQALSLGGLFSAGSLFSTLTGSAAETLYDHGMLKHQEAAAVAVYDSAAATYRGTVLSSLQNVADSLAALSSDADELRAAAASERTAARALVIVRSQQQAGQISTLTALNAELTYQQAALALVQTQANRYEDTAALFEALGGGWWNRSETQAQR